MFRPNNSNSSFNTEEVLKSMPGFEGFDIGNSQNLANSIGDLKQQEFEARQAQINAAEDIAVIRENTDDIIVNQKHLIDSQKENINAQKEIIEQLRTINYTQTQQLQRLKEIFYSVEDGTDVNKQVMAELEKLLEQQPGWKEFIADKGADVVVGVILAAMPKLLLKLGVVL